MTAKLDPLLEPGETVAFRARGRSLVRIWSLGCAIIATAIGFVMIAGTTTFGSLQPPGGSNASFEVFSVPAPIILALLLLCGIGFAAEWWRQRRDPDEVLITDWRILFANSDWNDKAETMALRVVEHISRSASGARGALVVKGAGRKIRLPVMRDADALANALGRATGKPHPRPLGPMAFVDLSPFAMMVVFTGTYVALTSWFESLGYLAPGAWHDMKPGSTDLIYAVIAIGASFALTWFLGELPDKLLNVTTLRPFATAEQMEAGLSVGQPDTWRTRIALRWAGLLYGRPLCYVSDGA